ncbi:hypothetical protein FB45DRAFT_923109 [Roridomyces roridus]|uniref:Uncharacterized protein n=1 Tax=Roridomyces roridus TaxID=1738132 RepID=A0AAD7BNN0_9AGAR|nr:hypothetical protein FB45DRAFT_923109 [Roridomyces roridus]
MTIIVYNDNSTFEQILAEVMKAQKYRHPYLAQLFGLTCSSGVNALIFHDEMLTPGQVLEMHSNYALSWRYILCEMQRQYDVECTLSTEAKTDLTENAKKFWLETTGDQLDVRNGSAWISSATGQLCWNIGVGERGLSYLHLTLAPLPGNLVSMPLTHPGRAMDEELFRALTHDQLFVMFPWLSLRFGPFYTPRSPSLSFPSMWNLQGHEGLPMSSIILNPISASDCDVVAWEDFLPWDQIQDIQDWDHVTVSSISPGWTRVEYHRTEDIQTIFKMSVTLSDHKTDVVKKWWLSRECTLRSIAIGLLPCSLTLWEASSIRLIDHSIKPQFCQSA